MCVVYVEYSVCAHCLLFHLESGQDADLRCTTTRAFDWGCMHRLLFVIIHSNIQQTLTFSKKILEVPSSLEFWIFKMDPTSLP